MIVADVAYGVVYQRSWRGGEGLRATGRRWGKSNNAADPDPGDGHLKSRENPTNASNSALPHTPLALIQK